MIRYADWVSTKKKREVNERDIWVKIEEVLTRAGYKNNLGGCWRVFGIRCDYPEIEVEIRPKNGYIFVHYKEYLDREEDGLGEDKIEENEIRIEESDVIGKEGKNLAEKWANIVLDVVDTLMGNI